MSFYATATTLMLLRWQQPASSRFYGSRLPLTGAAFTQVTAFTEPEPEPEPEPKPEPQPEPEPEPEGGADEEEEASLLPEFDDADLEDLMD